MHKKIQAVILFLFIITTEVTLGKSNNTKLNKGNHKKHSASKEKFNNERIKRSLTDEEDQPFWPNRGKKQVDVDPRQNTKVDNGLEINQRIKTSSEKLINDQPFWGNRGKRDGSTELFIDYPYPEFLLKHCDHCAKIPIIENDLKNTKGRRDDLLYPFWANRGKIKSFDVDDFSEPFWGKRGRRQEQEPFMENRGRLKDQPLGENKGRREEEPFWGSRGRREEEPFWGNRGRRDEEPFWGNRGRREDVEPFWGNRGRREDSEPFWGNRGRRQDNEPFWGNRGRRDEEPFWGNRGRRKESELNVLHNKQGDLKEYILSAINNVEHDIESLSRLKKSAFPTSFSTSRGRDNKLSVMFTGLPKIRSVQSQPEIFSPGKSTEPGTVLNDKMYVEEPNFILVERSSRSSGEDDPYYISRGKKYYLSSSLKQAARDRRGAIEEIVKSVRNDPYYIARGKKDIGTKNSGLTLSKEENMKAKELICAAINLIMTKKDAQKFKREINNNERDRRTILKKLAAQLQIDPYFVSRGKKSYISGEKDYLQEFISNVSEKCD